MRIAPHFIALALGAALAAATSANATNQRVNGAYTSVTARDAAACARACADDGLCIAWIRNADATCDLMAIAPTAPPATGADVGIATRAPSFAAWPRPVSPSEPVVTLVVAAPEVAPREPETEATLALLGGPDDELLRPRLGARQ